MALTYSTTCNSPRRKTEFLYRAQEELRLLHNIFSKWLHEGLTEAEYAQIPLKLKEKYPFKEHIVWYELIPEEDHREVAIAGDQIIEADIINQPEVALHPECYRRLDVPRLLKSVWDKFQKEDFNSRSDKICQEICVQRVELKKSTEWSIDIGDV